MYRTDIERSDALLTVYVLFTLYFRRVALYMYAKTIHVQVEMSKNPMRCYTL